ncbi:MAG: glycosyltransferase family 39 protein [Candidatus Korobacteraceae bacterium]|jgi:hypothetical protein
MGAIFDNKKEIPGEITVAMEQQPKAKVSPDSNYLILLLVRLSLIAVSGLAVFYALGQHVLRNWDESIYAEIAKEMLNRHSWLTPHFDFRPWLEKPPLFMWLTTLMFRLFGVSEFSARVTGALCGVGTIWLTFEIGRRLMDEWVGLTAALVLLTNGYFLYVIRFGSIDMPLTFCLTLVAYAYVRVRQGDPRWWYAAGAATGMAVMLKGAAGAAAPMALCLALLIDRRFAELRSPEVRNSALLACAIALPWHLAMLFTYGRRFLNEYIGYQVIARATKAIEGRAHDLPAYFYLQEYWQFFLPFALLALVGLVLYIRGQQDSSIVVSYVLVITLGFTLVRTKLHTYVVPAFPFISLLAALAIRTLLKNARYAAICALVLFPLYWFFQTKERPDAFEVNYSKAYVPPGPITSQQDPLMRLLLQAQAGNSEPAGAPLIVCFDGLIIEKQQLLFYSERPVLESFFSTTPDSSRESRYWSPIPLELAVGSRSSPIIIPAEMSPELAYSGNYNFEAIATDGPLVLGQISRR